MKHNVFLGSGSGSIGDVVSYRREGTQVSRMRVREIKNPRTYNQAKQRCFLAPVSKFYAPLASALEQSWEGKSTAKSYAAFSSAAVKKARKLGFYLPKGLGFYPCPYQLSQGTIAPLNQVYNSAHAGNSFYINIPVVAESGQTVNTVGGFATSMIAAGYNANDQITVIVVKKTDDNAYIPTYKRFLLDEASTVTLSEAFGIPVDPASGSADHFSCTLDVNVVGVAVIVSRWENDKWRRSTQSLCVSEAIYEYMGEVEEEAITSYMGSSNDPISEVYLNGSTANQQ